MVSGSFYVHFSIFQSQFSIDLPTERRSLEQSIVQPCQCLPCGSIGNAGLGQLKNFLCMSDSGLCIRIVLAGERHGGNPVIMRRTFAQHELEHIHRGTFRARFQHGIALRREECRLHGKCIGGDKRGICSVDGVPCALVGGARHRKAVLLLIIAHGSGSLCIRRCRPARAVQRYPQTAGCVAERSANRKYGCVFVHRCTITLPPLQRDSRDTVLWHSGCRPARFRQDRPCPPMSADR